jgi:hypothetical protein
MRRTKMLAALAAGTGGVAFCGARPASAQAEPVEFQIVEQTCSVDQGRGSATFSITFDRVPNFSREGHSQANAFQYEIDADATNFEQPLEFSDVDAVIRGGEIFAGQGIPVRDPEGEGDENSGGWGPVRTLVPYAVEGETLTFTVGLSAIGDDDGQFRYRVFSTEAGGLTGESVGAVVPLPAGAWTGLTVLGGMAALTPLRRRLKRAAVGIR